MRQDCIFFNPIRVRYVEVDKQGIVYNGHFMTYTDVTFAEFMRHKGYPYNVLVEEYGFEVCHVKATFEFYGSAYEDNMLEVGVRVVRVGEKSFTLGFEVYRQGEDDVLVYAEFIYSGYDSANRKSRPLSDLMRSILAA